MHVYLIKYKCFHKYQIFFIEDKYILLNIKFYFSHISATMHTSILGYVQLTEMRHFRNFLNRQFEEDPDMFLHD